MALFRSRLSVVVLAVALLFLCLFAALSASFSVSSGLRLWIWWKARHEHLSIKIDKVEAPFLRPVVLHGFQLISEHETAFRIEASAARIDVALNLKAIVLHASSRAIRHVAIDGLQMEIRRGNSAEPSLSDAGWRTLQKLLPGSFDLQRLNLRIETGRTVLLLRNVSVSGNEIEAGRFASDQAVLMSPWFRQSFSQLRGATKWEENRLTLAGLSLAPGLDLPSIASNLSQLDRQRIGVDVDAEVFGGNMRADVSYAWGAGVADWKVTGSAGDISLAQTAQALGFAEPLGGLLQACNFTFRGNLVDPTGATGWLWTELSAPSWRDRGADVVMVGATLASREIHLQQLYVKQGANELTLSGEGTFPGSWSKWLSANFRGDLSAAIVNLRDFAGLFGAKHGEFAGALTVDGTVKARDRKISGHFSADGSGLMLFKQPVDLLTANLNLKGTELEIEKFKLSHGENFLQATGNIDIRQAANSHGTIDASVGNLSDYLRAAPAACSLTARLTFDGRSAFIESLQLNDGPLAIEFGGTIDFASLQNIGITLIPTDLLFDLGWLDHVDCASAIQFFPATESNKFLPQIQRIDLRGDVLRRRWRIALRNDIGPDQEWRLCRRRSGNFLNVAVRDAATIEFGQSALRAFSNGAQQPLSLLPDHP
jgi:hypothetical protein